MDIPFQNTIGQPVMGVRALFNTPRADLTGFRVVLPPGVRAISADVNRYGADLRWDTPLAPGDTAILQVEMANGSVLVSRAMWYDANGVLKLPPTPTAEDMMLQQAYSMSDVAVRDDVIRLVRRAMLGALPRPDNRRGDLRRDQMFFCKLDIVSNAALMAFGGEGNSVTTRRTAILTRMLDHLQERLMRRMHRGRKRAAFVNPPPSDDEIREISELQLEIYENHFISQNTLDRNAVWAAFARFANGELRCDGRLWDDWDSAPRGAFFFFFAEFAFMACDACVHVKRWEPLMAPLVASQRVYIQAYRPDAIADHSLRFGDYGPENWKETKMVDQITKDAIWNRFDQLSPKQLREEACRNVLDAFPGGG